ncbi:MAG: ATP-binding cassette domain-containing protein [Proteobacteria bacterium]|nr:ATP-binding cassette domain-containing protein [Pseudomonadota bacterium]
MIELRRVCMHRPGEPNQAVLDGVDLAVGPGQVALLSGPTGAGKSTLLGLLYAAQLADSGTVSVFGRDVARLRRSSIALLRQCIGVVRQPPMLLEDRSALANVALPLEIRGEARGTVKERAMNALEQVGLAEHADTNVGRFSIGQKQWIAVARALVGEPYLVVADQPSTYFDATHCDRFVEILITLQRRGTAAVVATNDYRLLHAGVEHGWSHLELKAGAVEVIADGEKELRAPSNDAASSAGDHCESSDSDEYDLDDYDSIDIFIEDSNEISPHNIISSPIYSHAEGAVE